MGIYTADYTAPRVTQRTNLTITVNASKKGYLPGNGTLQVTVHPVIQRGSLLIRVTDQDGNPIEGALIESIAQPQDQQPLKGKTDRDGKVSFGDLIPGLYRIQANATGLNSGVEEVNIPNGGSAAMTISLKRPPSPLQTLTASPYMIIPIPAAVAILAAVLVLRRRKGENKEELMEEETS